MSGGRMQSHRIHRLSSDRSIRLDENTLLSIKGRNIQIVCRQGTVWVTWPNGNERVLRKEQTMTITSNGLICIQAFAPSTIIVRKTEHAIVRPCLPCPAESPAG